MLHSLCTFCAQFFIFFSFFFLRQTMTVIMSSVLKFQVWNPNRCHHPLIIQLNWHVNNSVYLPVLFCLHFASACENFWGTVFESIENFTTQMTLRNLSHHICILFFRKRELHLYFGSQMQLQIVLVISKIFSITRTIFSHSRSEQFW